jgi:cytochrome c553
MKRSGYVWTWVAAMAVGGSFVFSQESTQKVIRTLPMRPVATFPTPIAPPAPPIPPTLYPVPQPGVPRIPQLSQAPPKQLSSTVIAWDADTKEYKAGLGEMSAPFTFNFTNVSSGEVAINSVNTSCGCTVAKLPPLPWKIAPGTNGVIPVTMNLAGKNGTVFKSVTVNTDQGYKALLVKVVIPPPPPPPVVGPMDRQRNVELAKADRQAVFKGDCARCHVEPAKGKSGKELYVAACGICHEAEHRATMVADLHAIKLETNAEFWKTWIAHGKVGTLMPAFAQSDGGPLTDAQIISLVDYLVATIPSHATAQTAKPVSAVN